VGVEEYAKQETSMKQAASKAMDYTPLHPENRNHIWRS
jgi:hypothetical protein